MLRRMKDLKDYTIQATDGVVGMVKDFYFDDVSWVIRYLVVEVDPGGSGHQVLVSPISIDHPNWEAASFPTMLTRRQIEDSPSIDTDKPASRVHEARYHRYYDYGTYWGGAGLWGAGPDPRMLQVRIDRQREADSESALPQHHDVHLRSANEVRTYRAHASDGEVGHVKGFLVDEASWQICFLVVNTREWWIGHEVLIAPRWITKVDWLHSEVSVEMTRDAIRDAPPYDARMLLRERREDSAQV